MPYWTPLFGSARLLWRGVGYHIGKWEIYWLGEPRELIDKRPHKLKDVRRSAKKVQLREIADDGQKVWEFVHPQCAIDREMDLKEVEAMIELGEHEIATEELRWLLDGCSDFIHAHRLLGQLALEREDFPLARGHFGHAFRVGAAAIRQVGGKIKVPHTQKPNRHFLECGKGLIYCLIKLGKKRMAGEIVDQLLECDPSDPLQVRTLLKA